VKLVKFVEGKRTYWIVSWKTQPFFYGRGIAANV